MTDPNPYNLQWHVVRINGMTVTHIPPEENNNGATINQTLIVSPGRYKLGQITYDMTTPGLYKFIYPLSQNQNWIVYNGDPYTIINAVMWLTTQGYVDGGQNFSTLAMSKKLSIACLDMSNWCVSLLISHGHQARVVQSITAETFNNYNDGHAMPEFYDTTLNKWVVVDLSFNCRFILNGVPCSFIELVENQDAVVYESMADVTFCDVTGMTLNTYQVESFFASLTDVTMRRYWYQRILQIPLINGYYYADGQEAFMQQYNKISYDAFMTMFY